MSATCRRFGAHARNPRSTRSGLPPVPLAGRVVTGARPRRTPLMPGSRMIRATRSRPIPVHPCAGSWACIFLYPYTAMKKPEWICMMSRARAS